VPNVHGLRSVIQIYRYIGLTLKISCEILPTHLPHYWIVLGERRCQFALVLP
jgi:hypothetical protein